MAKLDIDISDIEIFMKPVKRPGRVLAKADLSIGEVIEIKGFTVSKANHLHSKFQEYIWIQPPKVPPHFIKVAYINDKHLWEEIEEKIYSLFNQLRAKNPDRFTSSTEEIDPDEIPDFE